MDYHQRRHALVHLIDLQCGRCCYCRRQFTADGSTRPTIEHKKARMDGGTDEITNLAAACHHCNSLRGQQMHEARMKAKQEKSAPEKSVLPAKVGTQLGSSA